MSIYTTELKQWKNSMGQKINRMIPLIVSMEPVDPILFYAVAVIDWVVTSSYIVVSLFKSKYFFIGNKDDWRFRIIAFFFTYQGQGYATIRNHSSQHAYSDYFRRSRYYDQLRTSLDALFFILKENEQEKHFVQCSWSVNQCAVIEMTNSLFGTPVSGSYEHDWLLVKIRWSKRILHTESLSEISMHSLIYRFARNLSLILLFWVVTWHLSIVNEAKATKPRCWYLIKPRFFFTSIFCESTALIITATFNGVMDRGSHNAHPCEEKPHNSPLIDTAVELPSVAVFHTAVLKRLTVIVLNGRRYE